MLVSCLAWPKDGLVAGRQNHFIVTTLYKHQPSSHSNLHIVICTSTNLTYNWIFQSPVKHHDPLYINIGYWKRNECHLVGFRADLFRALQPTDVMLMAIAFIQAKVQLISQSDSTMAIIAWFTTPTFRLIVLTASKWGPYYFYINAHRWFWNIYAMYAFRFIISKIITEFEFFQDWKPALDSSKRSRDLCAAIIICNTALLMLVEMSCYVSLFNEQASSILLHFIKSP